MTYNQRVSQRLHDMRKKLGYTQETVAAILGLSQSQYLRIEDNPHRMTISQAALIVSFFKTTFDELFSVK